MITQTGSGFQKGAFLLFTLLSGAFFQVAASPEIESRLRAIESSLAQLPSLQPSLQTHQRLGMHGYAAAPTEVTIDLGDRVTPDRIAIFPVRLPVSSDLPSPGFPSSLTVEIALDPDFARAVRLLDWQEVREGFGETLPFLMAPGNGASGRYLKITVTGLREDPLQPGELYFRLGEVMVLENGRNAALRRPVTSTPSLENPRRWEPGNLTDGYFWCLPLRGASGSPSNGFQSAVQRLPRLETHAWVEIDLGKPTAMDEIHLVPAHPREFSDSFGFGFPPRFWVHADVGTAKEVELLRETDPPFPAEGLPNPGSAQVMLPTPGLKAQRIRVSAETLWRRGPSAGAGPSEHVLALGELQIWQGGKNLSIGKAVTASDQTSEPNWSTEALVDGHSSRHALLSWDTWLDEIGSAFALQQEASTLRQNLLLQRETRQQRMLTGALLFALLTVLVTILIVMLLRGHARQSRELLRARIARDLHDEIGASLSHLAMQSDLARRQLDQGALQPERLKTISGTARETLDHMRDIIWLLAPKEGDWQDLSDRLESITQRLLEGVEHSVKVEGTPPDGEPPIAWAREAVSFLKETLTNVRRHSQATQVTVALYWKADFRLRVEDDGVGFDPAETQSEGSGLENLKNRAQAMKGNLDIQSQANSGTTTILTAPLPGPIRTRSSHD